MIIKNEIKTKIIGEAHGFTIAQRTFPDGRTLAIDIDCEGWFQALEDGSTAFIEGCTWTVVKGRWIPTPKWTDGIEAALRWFFGWK